MSLVDLFTPAWVKPAIIAAVLAVTFSGGWYVEGLRWSKSAAKIELAGKQQAIDLLKANISIIAEALRVDSTQAIADAKSMDDLERIQNEIVSKASDGICLSPDATERLRALWQ